MDIPEYDKVEREVDLLVDSAVAECGDGGEPNAMQNEPSEKPEEELSRAHDDIAGYGDPEDIEQEYPPGPNGVDGIQQDGEEDIGGQLESILSEKGEYHAFFKRMMDSEGVSSIAQMSHDKKSDFFKKVSAGWKKEKGQSVAESFGYDK